jgi:hypothetical protein
MALLCKVTYVTLLLPLFLQQALVEEESKSAAIIQSSLLQLLDKLLEHMLSEDAVPPHRCSTQRSDVVCILMPVC